VAAFFRLLRANVEPMGAEVEQLLVDGETAIVSGEFASRMLATGKVVESLFFIQLTVHDGQIARYRLLEDSHAVVVALTP
jgi:ketosteroid isomerase-like protein